MVRLGLIAVVGFAMLFGCDSTRGGALPSDGSGVLGPDDVDRLELLGPFAPESMRVFPLTHAEVTPEGGAQVVLHLELRDRWGDTVKGTGQVKVRLYRGSANSGGLLGSARQRQELTWDVDLTDLGLNAVLYDPSTRTYRIVLGELPEWAAGLATGGGNQAVTLVVVWIGRDSEGDVISLRDVYRLGG
ncbi:MAG: hypothetical protein AAGI53_04095 [Planctomycetota bacterium]